jgi:hypothetical protein
VVTEGEKGYRRQKTKHIIPVGLIYPSTVSFLLGAKETINPFPALGSPRSHRLLAAACRGESAKKYKKFIVKTKSQGCGSGMFIPDPRSRIPDPKLATKKRDEKTKLLSYLFL